MALTGSVSRWFNRKGFGFINVVSSDSDQIGNDIFVHLSGINVSNDGYKSLYPGEYVSFDLDKNDKGQFVCVNVTGVMGGPLLIEHPEYRYKYFQRNPRPREERDNASANNASADNASADNASANNASADNTSADNASADNASADNASADNASAETPEVDENDPEQA
jgi:cold shock CspA family protein